MSNNITETETIFIDIKKEKFINKINRFLIVLDQFQKRHKFISALFGIIIFYFLGFILPYFYELIGLDCLNFIEINNQKANEIIKLRFITIITIIGFTFAIFALTLNNLAEKDKNTNIFIEESYVLNVVYFVILSSISLLFITIYFENFIIIQDFGIISNYLTGLILALFLIIIQDFKRYSKIEFIDKIREQKLNAALITIIAQDGKVILYKSNLKAGEFKLDFNRPIISDQTDLKSETDYFKDKMYKAIKNFEYDQFKKYEQILLNAIAQNIIKYDNSKDKELGIYNFIEFYIRPWINDKKSELKDETQLATFRSFENGINQITP